jgi:hypothetical protein
MALTFSGSRCAICNDLLGERPYLATNGLFFPENTATRRFIGTATRRGPSSVVLLVSTFSTRPSPWLTTSTGAWLYSRISGVLPSGGRNQLAQPPGVGRWDPVEQRAVAQSCSRRTRCVSSAVVECRMLSSVGAAEVHAQLMIE